MQEADEQDTCRICSAPAELDQPLFHPCKCSGTIRYIHQDCLTTWLAHSKKKNCDVCKHPYSFTKVYASDMPSKLPPILLFRRLARYIFDAFVFVLRGICVTAIWLGLLPWVTVWTWRMYFSMGESTAWWISDRPKPSTEENNTLYNKLQYKPPPTTKNLVEHITSHPVWIALPADIFTGQIIASLIVLTFVAVFLLREWISQNARPGVFEEEEPFPDDPLAGAQPQPQQPAQNPFRPAAPIRQPLPQVQNEANRQQQPEGFPEPAMLVQRQADAMRAVNAMQQPPVASTLDFRPEEWVLDPAANARVGGRKKRKKAKEWDFESERERIIRPRRRVVEDLEGREYRVKEIGKHPVSSRTIFMRSSFPRRRVLLPANGQSSSEPLDIPPEQSTFDFSFERPSSSQSNHSSSNAIVYDASSSTNGTTAFHSPFPQIELQPPTSALPFSLRPEDHTEPEPSTVTNPYASPNSIPSRPPLPTTTLPRSGSTTPFRFSPARTPLGSPSLATYLAPEELEAEAGPSNSSNYFSHLHGQGEGSRGFGFVDEDVVIDDDLEDEDEDIEERPGQYSFDEAEVEGVEPPEGVLNGMGRVVPASESDTDEDSGAENVNGNAEGLGDRVVEDEDDGLFRDGDEDEEDEVEAEGLFDDDAQWEEVEVRVEGAQPAPGAGGPAVPAQPNNQPGDAVVPAVAGLDLNDEVEGNVEDDMEGAMEAIGMRGPFYGVFQNAALMIFVLDTAIGLGIWIPFTVGKTTALLSLDPQRFLQVLHLPIRAMRLVTDPIVDSVVYIIVELLLPRILSLLSRVWGLFMFFGSSYMGSLLGNETTTGVSEFSSRVYNHSTDLLTSFWTPPTIVTQEVTNSTSSTSDLISSIPDYLGFTEPYFAWLGREVRLLVGRMQSTWIHLSLGSGATERVFAVFLGYLVVSFAFCLYLNILTVGNAKTAGLAVRNAVRQQLLVLKVAAFIFIELVTFPLGCGIVLDLCTVWLFPEANMQSRAAFFVQAPLTAMFYHWVAGTMFMYSFAVLLSGCRSVMRPGAMWFIKDPQDQNSHPIRDILDRPTFTQLRKICVSGIMYSFVVACVVGSVAGLLVLGSKSIMPFRWKNREPLSNVPVDLLFLHLVLPYTVHYFRPKRFIKHVATIVWKFFAKRLRLTSYFFGGRHAPEEYTPTKWREKLIRPDEIPDEELVILDGSFRRVPATDNLALPRDMRATAEVTVAGEPVNDAAREIMATQDAETEKAKRNIGEDYMVVYIPPYFRWRVIGLVALLWVFGAISLGFAVALPIQLGRSFFKLFTAREVHDGYSFIIGFYLLWLCYLMSRAVDRLDKRRQRRSGDGPRANLYVLVMKRGLLWLAKTSYMVVFLGVVIPVLLAMVIDLYIILPIRFALDAGMVPRIRVVDSWALGLLYAKIAIHAHRLQPPNRISRGLQHIMVNGWTRPDPISATREVIAPFAGGLLGMILFPGVVFRIFQHFFPQMVLDNRFIFMHVYPSVFVFAGTIRSAVVLFDLMSSWSQAIRDKEFLVEMRLRNHDPEQDKIDVTKEGERGIGEGQTMGVAVGPADPELIEAVRHHQLHQ